MGGKGAALTTNISLPGRYLVLMYGSKHIGVSRKIEDEGQRKRLKDIVRGFDLPEGMGLIVRTAGMNRSKRELSTDFRYLTHLWETIQIRSKEIPSPSLIYQESDVVVTSIREYFTPEVKEVIIDGIEAYERGRAFFDEFISKYRRRVKRYHEEQPLFSRFQIEQQIDQIYSRQVPLRSGGRICIDIAEALVAVDVNSGRVPQATNIEQAALITNLEAADEIAHQLRLRDIGGLIVIDFIDMKSPQHNREVEKRLRNALKKDRAKVDMSRISRFGLLELSRQRLKSPLSEEAYSDCQHCQGRGRVRSTYAMALTVLRRIQERAVQNGLQMVRGTLSKPVADYLLNYKRDDLNAIESRHKLKIVIVGEDDLPIEEHQLEFIRKEEGVPVVAEEDAARQKGDAGKPWYKKLLAFKQGKGD